MPLEPRRPRGQYELGKLGMPDTTPTQPAPRNGTPPADQPQAPEQSKTATARRRAAELQTRLSLASAANMVVYLTRQEIAWLLAIDERTLVRMIQRREFPPADRMIARRSPRWLRATVEEWMRGVPARMRAH